MYSIHRSSNYIILLFQHALDSLKTWYESHCIITHKRRLYTVGNSHEPIGTQDIQPRRLTPTHATVQGQIPVPICHSIQPALAEYHDVCEVEVTVCSCSVFCDGLGGGSDVGDLGVVGAKTCCGSADVGTLGAVSAGNIS